MIWSGVTIGEDGVDETLASVAFFIPVLTPRYFASAECRRELQFFARRATDLGIKELVLPLLYADVASLHDNPPADDLAALVRTFQWVDWTDIRLASPDSEAYRRAVAELATRLVAANAETERKDVAEAAAHLRETIGSDLDAPGWLDQIGDSLTAMPEWGRTLEAIAPEIQKIGEMMVEATGEIRHAEARGQGIAARLSAARRLGHKLAEPAENIYSYGNQFAGQLHAVDTGVRILIERLPGEVGEDVENRERACAYFAIVTQISQQTHELLSQTQSFVEAIAPLEAMSRDLRRPLRRLREGLTLMVEAKGITDEWVRLVDNSEVDCPDVVDGTQQ